MSTSPRAVDEVLDLRRPFTWAAARKAGVPERRLRSAEFVSVFHGVYVARSVPRTLRLRAQAALLVAPPTAVVSHHTASFLYGGVVPASSAIHLSMAVRLNCKKAGIRPHRLLHPPPAVPWLGLRVTSVERTFCDMATACDLVDLVVLGDRLVRRNRTTLQRLRMAAENWSGDHRGLLRRAAALVRERVDSPPESKLRLLLVLAGIPEPEVDIRFDDPHTGDLLRRLDTGWRDIKVAAEYDGGQHREDDEIWDSDITRHEEFREQRDWRIVRVTKTGLYQEPMQTLRRVDAARVDRGGSATTFRDEWQRYFPGRADQR